MIAMLPSFSLGNEVTFHCLYHLDACGECGVDVKSEQKQIKQNLICEVDCIMNLNS